MSNPPNPAAEFSQQVEAPWTQGYLDFLTDDACPSLFMDLLDPQTLQAVCTHNTDVLGPPPLPPSEDTRKKLMEQDSDDSDAEEGSGASKGAAGGGAGGGSASNKRARSEANQAAKNKATREKARREKINDRWVLGRGVGKSNLRERS